VRDATGHDSRLRDAAVRWKKATFLLPGPHRTAPPPGRPSPLHFSVNGMVSQLAIFSLFAAAASAAYDQSAGTDDDDDGRPEQQHWRLTQQADDAAGPASHQLSPRGAGDMLSALDFGAKADGRTDDSAAVQRAVDAAQTQNLPLLLPSGTYLLTSPVIVRADVKPKKPKGSAAMPGSSQQRIARRAARQQLAAASRPTSSATAQVYNPLRMMGDGIEQSVLVAGAPMAAVISLPNISQFIDFSHFGIDCNKSAEIGIDAPNTLVRSRFVAVGVNHSRTGKKTILVSTLLQK